VTNCNDHVIPSEHDGPPLLQMQTGLKSEELFDEDLNGKADQTKGNDSVYGHDKSKITPQGIDKELAATAEGFQNDADLFYDV